MEVEYIAKVGNRLGLLRITTNDLSENAANVIYKSFIQPVLGYCSAAWACCNRGDIYYNSCVVNNFKRNCDILELFYR